MKKLASLILFSAIFILPAFAVMRDSIYQKQAPVNMMDTLKQKLELTSNDSLKAGIYTQIAAQYLKYDTISDKKTRLRYQNQALNYTMLALHGYSKYNDSVGLRTCFDNLTKVYHSQKKYSQAKWFILQSNSLSRTMNDVPNIITSLNTLAGIKMDIKDYSLAMRDLKEALQLSSSKHYAMAEASIQESFAVLYSHLNEYGKEAIATRRHDQILDSLRKVEEAKLVAKVNAQDSVQRKKKLNLISYGKAYKTNSLKRIASL
jgi:tetratricopeptide (TPR) repeat protein